MSKSASPSQYDHLGELADGSLTMEIRTRSVLESVLDTCTVNILLHVDIGSISVNLSQGFDKNASFVFILCKSHGGDHINEALKKGIDGG